MTSIKEFFIRAALKLAFTVYPPLYRVKNIGRPAAVKSTPLIYAHFHGDELVLVPANKGLGIATLSSASRDGRRMSDLLRYLGYHPVEGSSSTKAVSSLIALKKHACAHPGPVSFAVDGPRGPRHVIKPGVLWLSAHTGAPIVFVAAACNRRWVFERSWNQAYVPKPGARVLVYCSRPFTVARGTDVHALAEALSPWMRRWHTLVQTHAPAMLAAVEGAALPEAIAAAEQELAQWASTSASTASASTSVD